MTLTIIIVLASMILALNGLVLQPKKDPQKSTSWTNLNNTGKILFVIIILMSLLIIIKNTIDEINGSVT